VRLLVSVPLLSICKAYAILTALPLLPPPPSALVCLCLPWQWNYDRSFDDYVIADATDSGCVITVFVMHMHCSDERFAV